MTPLTGLDDDGEYQNRKIDNPYESMNYRQAPDPHVGVSFGPTPRLISFVISSMDTTSPNLAWMSKRLAS